MTFNFFGIQIEITFLFVAFISFIISLKAPSNVIMTVVSSMLHESGHLLIMLLLDNKPEKLRFELTGINIIRKQDIKIGTKDEIMISLGGPTINFIIVIICCVLLSDYNDNKIMTFACINLILMIFNLLPIKKLDGGRVLFYLLSVKCIFFTCSKILKLTSVIFITIIFVWGIYVFVSSKYNFSLIIIAIFLFLSLFTDNEY